MKRFVPIGAVLVVAGALLASTGALAQEGVDVTFEELNESGITGSGTVAPGAEEGETDVSVSLTGLEPDASHVSHIHEGACESLGAIVVTLNNVEGDEDGNGLGETTVTESDTGDPLTFAGIANGDHVIAVHEGATLEEGPTPVSCGAIPAAEEDVDEAPVEEATPEEEEVVAPPDAGTGALAGGDSGVSAIIIAALAAAGLTALGAGGLALRAVRSRS